MAEQLKVVVVGATGFVGSAVVQALIARGAHVMPVAAPRLAPVEPSRLREVLVGSGDLIEELGRAFSNADVVVNAAGDPDASSRNEPSLMAANALLPSVIASAAQNARVGRLVHVSSAVVQGNAPALDESDLVRPFSAYSRSKALGEVLVREVAASMAVVYRPPSVHARDRRVSQRMAKLARSPLSSVARPGSSPSPQALLENVADAVAFLALCPERPPSVVIHPSEGLTTASVLSLLGGREPLVVPRPLASLLVRTIMLAGRAIPALAANARRIEVLWFGQPQSRSWLTGAGWVPHAGPEAWRQLGNSLADGSAKTIPPGPTDRTDDANESVG